MGRGSKKEHQEEGEEEMGEQGGRRAIPVSGSLWQLPGGGPATVATAHSPSDYQREPTVYLALLWGGIHIRTKDKDLCPTELVTNGVRQTLKNEHNRAGHGGACL